jgi:hypothetical protein
VYLIGYVAATLVTIKDIGICDNNTSNPISALNTTELFHEPCAGQMLGILTIM